MDCRRANVPKSPNWCFFEYDLAYRQDSERVLFVQIEDDIRKDGVHAKFDAWYKTYSTKDSLKLKPTRTRSQKVFDENREAIREKRGEQIERVWKRLYFEIPE